MIEAILEPPLSSSITIELTESIRKEVKRGVKPETEQEVVCARMHVLVEWEIHWVYSCTFWLTSLCI